MCYYNLCEKGCVTKMIIIIAFISVLILNTDAIIEDRLVSAIKKRGERLNFTELCDEIGLPVQEYEVITEDGYILSLFRIPGRKPPVLLTHGFQLAADSWLLRGNNSLPVLLSNLGHDLWLANTRGNIYSRRHIYLNPDTDTKFWEYSFHELGYYDLPAIIDTILEKTNTTKIKTIGFSEGTTMFYVLAATRPEYNEKINYTIALAPVVYLSYVHSPLSIAIAFTPEVNILLKAIGMDEFLGYNSTLVKIIREVCTLPIIGYAECALKLVFPILGYDVREIDPSFFRIVPYYFPVGSSRKVFIHYGQVSKSGVFKQYDYGVKGNIEFYNSTMPPVYNISNVKIPMVLLVGSNDKLATVPDVLTLRGQLPNVQQMTILPRNEMNHLDFVWGKNMHKYLFPFILKAL